MHMSDALLSPTVGAAFWMGSAGAIAVSSRKLNEDQNEKAVPLMGVMGAFIFAAQMVNFTIPGTGSSGHLAGGMILAVLLGPFAAFLVMTSILTVQALFFADGGLLALGCNIWNLGVYSCFIAYPLVFRPLVRKRLTRGSLLTASLVSAIVALELGALSVVIETQVSGQSDLPLKSFLWLMLPIHFAIGVVEGLVTAGILYAVRAARPELLENKVPVRRLAVVFLFLALFTGGFLTWFSSLRPDGLEWSVGRVSGNYEQPARNQPSKARTSASGILGSLSVMGFVALIGAGLRTIRKRGR